MVTLLQSTLSTELAGALLSPKGAVPTWFPGSYLATACSGLLLGWVWKCLSMCSELSTQLIKRERGHAHNLCLALGNLQIVNSI